MLKLSPAYASWREQIRRREHDIERVGEEERHREDDKEKSLVDLLHEQLRLRDSELESSKKSVEVFLEKAEDLMSTAEHVSSALGDRCSSLSAICEQAARAESAALSAAAQLFESSRATGLCTSLHAPVDEAAYEIRSAAAARASLTKSIPLSHQDEGAPLAQQARNCSSDSPLSTSPSPRLHFRCTGDAGVGEEEDSECRWDAHVERAP